MKFIARYDAAVPCFLYLALNAPHTFYQAPQAYLDRYKNIAEPSRRAYAAMITAVASGSWGGRCPSLGGYVTRDGAQGRGGRRRNVHVAATADAEGSPSGEAGQG